MEWKSRILSIFVTIAIIVGIGACFIVFLKDDNKHIYAESIEFVSLTGSFEMSIDSQLVIDNTMVKIIPNNQNLVPEFTIKKSGSSVERVITEGKYTFEEIGRYILTCKVKASKKYYLEDTLRINVVQNPTSSTSMYINKLPNIDLYVEGVVKLSSLVQTVCPEDTKVDVVCDKRCSFDNNRLTLLQEGVANIDISLTYDGIKICKTVAINIKPKIEQEDIGLVLTIGSQIVDNNKVEIKLTEFVTGINYYITLEDEQEIECWTYSENLQVIRYNVPLIELLTLRKGEAVLYIRPINYPQLIFEVMITII